MEKFAFVIHPIVVRDDASKKFPVARWFPEPVVAAAMRHVEPMVVAHLEGIRSIAGPQAEGWFIGCPLAPKYLLGLPPEDVYKKLEICCRKAEALGAKLIGLGALTSVAGDGGITLAKRTSLAVTTGNSYTVATAVEGAKLGAEAMGIAFGDANVAVIGAAGSIGRTAAMLLGPDARRTTLIGRQLDKLAPVARDVAGRGARKVDVSDDIAAGLADADVVVTVTSSADAIVEPRHLKKGSVVCDVARPRDVSVRVSRERPDVLVIEGGLVRIPGAMTTTTTSSKGVDRADREPFSFGFPPGTAYACMSETMMLALDGRYESFTLGKTVSVEQVEEMWRLAKKHGFKLDGFRSFETEVTAETIANVRKAAGR